MIMGIDDWWVLGSMSICRKSVSTVTREGDVGMMTELTFASAGALLPAVKMGKTIVWVVDTAFGSVMVGSFGLVVLSGAGSEVLGDGGLGSV